MDTLLLAGPTLRDTAVAVLIKATDAMKTRAVRAHRSKDNLKRDNQLAWKIAEVAADPVEVDLDATDMIMQAQRNRKTW